VTRSPKLVEDLLNDIQLLGSARYELVTSIRDIVKKKFKPFSEEVKYGGILFSSGVQFCGVFAYSGHVSIEFGSGAKIVDEYGYLEGSGKLRRHLKLVTLSDVKSKKVAEYLKLALEASKR
jgi:hypothetical protein